MGYSEIPCRLCGVSFNISRIRRPDEPRNAAWHGEYAHLADSYVLAYEVHDSCEYSPTETGCRVVFRADHEGFYHPTQSNEEGDEEENEDQNEDDDPDDHTYVYQSEEEDEPYDYESDDEIIDSATDEDEKIIEVEGEVTELACSSSYLSELAMKSRPTEDISLPLSIGWTHDWSYTRKFEHIAGPECINEHGYNGYSISMEEMRSCVTLQCLMRKYRGWEPEIDDQDFELSSDFFLTGISDQMPCPESSPLVSPARHGVDSTYPGVIPQEPDLENMPFHPTCFEIFLRMSRQKLGYIDINGLMSWHNEDTFDRFPRSDPNVGACSRERWSHKKGTEYLAANPIFIPSLTAILRSAISDDPTFSVQNGAFEISNIISTQKRGLNYDPFLQLPVELTYSIISFLSSTDIAKLRLASRAFRQLPIILWHKLLKEEKPWIWEAWSTDAPYPWAYKTGVDIQAEEKRKQIYDSELWHYRRVIKQEMPEMLDDWIKAEPAYFPAFDTSHLNSMLPYLPERQTNWYEVYRSLTIHEKELKGLKNRARIWKDLEEIFRRMEIYRKERATSLRHWVT